MCGDVWFKGLILEEGGVKTPGVGLSRRGQVKIKSDGLWSDIIMLWYLVWLMLEINLESIKK